MTSKNNAIPENANNKIKTFAHLEMLQINIYLIQLMISSNKKVKDITTLFIELTWRLQIIQQQLFKIVIHHCGAV